MTDPADSPEVKAALVETDALALSLATYAVSTPAEYEGSGEMLKRVKAAQTKLEGLRVGITKPMNEALKRVNDLFRAPADKLIAAERTIKRALVAYTDEQERLRREAQARADADARRERERLEAIARETERKAREEQERLRREAEAAAAAGREAEAAALAAKAAKVEERAAVKAEQFTERAATVVAETVAAPAPPPKVQGVSTRTVWKFAIEDAAKINAPFLVPDEGKIRKTVAALKGASRDIIGAGVRVWEERDIASRGAL